ncbi:membrane protein required for colicin V production [Shimia isoporae]|uniref:Membrane protein required for colicin V production n=1 Tax=Shimia isoporae TaxID=647720 RepID=A0A4V2Q483_9RHOB|nr:CvpA family protein [Shimia isoporae]TCL09810.1 membrane protein required for colicin V production [Shimia isoporae]
MEGFTIIDGVVAGVIIISALLAYSRGIVREAMAIAGWVAAAILAYMFAAQAQPLVKEIPILKDVIGDNCEMALGAAFFGVFALALIVVSFFTPVFSSIVQRSALGGVDQALGFLFGAARGALLVAVAFFVYETMFTSQSFAMVDDSRSAEVFGRLTAQVDDRDPAEAMVWLEDKLGELSAHCAN